LRERKGKERKGGKRLDWRRRRRRRRRDGDVRARTVEASNKEREGKLASSKSEKKLTTPFCAKGITPSLTQNPQAPIKFAIITSVVSRSPTIASCDGDVTPVSGCF